MVIFNKNAVYPIVYNISAEHAVAATVLATRDAVVWRDCNAALQAEISCPVAGEGTGGGIRILGSSEYG